MSAESLPQNYLIDDQTFIKHVPRSNLQRNRAKEIVATIDYTLANLTPGPDGEACVGQAQYFYDEDGSSPYERRRNEIIAKRLCSVCPVVIECLNKAVKDGEKYGIWGGTNEKERNVLIKKRVASDERTRTRSA